MDSEFRKKVFNEEFFDFYLELLNLTDNFAAGPQSVELVRETVDKAFTLSSSEAEILSCLKTLNVMDLKTFKDELPQFFQNANLVREHSTTLYEDYLVTLRHIAKQKDFLLWSDFFKSLKSLCPFPEATVSDFLKTARHLSAGETLFAHWPDFFRVVKALTGLTPDIANDFFMTVRHLAMPDVQFGQWEIFFKSIIVLVEKKEFLIPFMTTVRHSLSYFRKPETMSSLLTTLSSQKHLSAFEAYSYGQLESKKWLIEELQKVRGPQWGVVFTLAGWIGSLAQMIFDHPEIQVEKIRSFDIDADACKLAEKLNNPQVLAQWKFKAVCMDVSLMDYPTHYFVKRHDGSVVDLYDNPDILINTSCEHIENLQNWWSKIPSGTFVVLQSNNAFQIKDHINCISSLEEFKKQLPLVHLDYAGELVLADYTRYMMIGRK